MDIWTKTVLKNAEHLFASLVLTPTFLLVNTTVMEFVLQCVVEKMDCLREAGDFFVMLFTT